MCLLLWAEQLTQAPTWVELHESQGAGEKAGGVVCRNHPEPTRQPSSVKYGYPRFREGGKVQLEKVT